jgi:hypothetical protein
MTYQSPLHILDSLHITPDELTPEGITRLRKKLLAEFSLTSDITIDVNGQSYTKDAVLKVIDQLKEVDNLVLHKAVFSRKSLLDWLENPQRSVFPQDLAQEVLDENLESDFYQKTLQTSLANYVKTHFKKRHFIQLQKTVPFIANLQEEYHYDVYNVIHGEIQVIIDEINHARKNPNIRENKERFGFISETQWTDFLNNLPNDFEGIREDYCYAAVNYTVAIQRKDKKWTYEISNQLNHTLCDGSIKDTIKNNHQIYADNYYADPNSTSEDKSLLSWIFRIIIIILFLGRLASCDKNSNDSSKKEKEEKIEFKADDILSKAFEDRKDIFYIMKIREYQRIIVNNKYEKNGHNIHIIQGEDKLYNLNFTDKDSIPTTPNTNPSELITFKNDTDYDVVILRAGFNDNRSFFIKKRSSFLIDSYKNDHLYFYFGKRWEELYSNVNSKEMNEEERFQGYFSETHKNTYKIFMKEFKVKKKGEKPVVTFDNNMLEKLLSPQTKNITFKEYDDTSIILQ